VAVRFEVSRVMDTIEQRLTTDPFLAQAVVDVSEVAGYTELDGGRGVNLIRLGMVVDALGRYLRDGGAYLYPVAPRALLSNAELTSKERMVLGRWTDEGLIEAAADAAGRVPEIAGMTGLPIISRRPYPELAAAYPFLVDAPHRVLTASARLGGALLTDGTGGTGGVPQPSGDGGDEDEDRRVTYVPRRVVGKASPISKIDPPGDGAAAPTAVPAGAGELAAGGQAQAGADDEPTLDRRRRSADSVPVWPDRDKVFYKLYPEPPAVPVTPSPLGTSLLARVWHCPGFDCPSFGEGRRSGQPVPHLRNGVPVCPRHDEPLSDVGARTPAVAVALIVEGLRRRRFLVTGAAPVVVGRDPEEPGGVAVGEWCHEAAANWISRTHLRLQIRDGALVATDVSTNGTLVWVRSGPEARPETLRLEKDQSYPMGEWDTVELYTGIELGRADRRPVGVEASSDEPASVLVDAPTVATRAVGGR
jgi:hypothetical protein